MKTHSRYDQMSKEYFQNWTKQYVSISPQYENHPSEDYHLLSKRYPIFIVADGVTLKRDPRGNYPIPSLAFELAKRFCETVIEAAENRYESFTENDLKEIFEIGNLSAKELNDAKGRTKENSDHREFDLFASTTAFALIKEDKMYWWSLHDSGIAIFDKTGVQLFQSPEAWPDKDEKVASAKISELSLTEFNKAKKRLFRNTLDAKGDRFGYGVVTGEPTVSAYLNYGTQSLIEGSQIFIYTDGYEDYIIAPEFISYFISWPENLEDQLNDYMTRKNSESIKYGRERSLIAVRY